MDSQCKLEERIQGEDHVGPVREVGEEFQPIRSKLDDMQGQQYSEQGGDHHAVHEVEQWAASAVCPLGNGMIETI